MYENSQEQYIKKITGLVMVCQLLNTIIELL